jgi:uncharacterized protein (TIGR03437 family)
MIEGNQMPAFPTRFIPCVVLLAAATASAQTPNYPYVLKTLAGSYPLGDGGPANQALLNGPMAITFDSSGAMLVLDAGNYRIRKISGGTISTLFSTNGQLCWDMKLAKDGYIYLTGQSIVFKISPSGTFTTIAGTGVAGTSVDGIPAVQAQLGNLTGLALDSANNVYFVDGNRIREVTVADGLIHTVAGNGVQGYLGDGSAATAAEFVTPNGIGFDAQDNLYIADQYNYRVRKVTKSDGIIRTIAGTGTESLAVEGNATLTGIGAPRGLLVDGPGNVYMTDENYLLVLKIGTDGKLTKLAGGAPVTYADGAAASVYFNGVAGLALDSSSNLFVTEPSNGRVRELTGGVVTSVVGRLHFAGDGGPATSALLNYPSDTALDSHGDVFIIDRNNFRIREIAANGTISTVAGNGIIGYPPESSAALTSPLPGALNALAIDGTGNTFLAVFQHVLKITPAGTVSTFAGDFSNNLGGKGDLGPAVNASFNNITGVAVDPAGNVYISDPLPSSNRIRVVSATDGVIRPFAGSGALGYGGDGGPATAATMSLGGLAPIGNDPKGNIFIGDVKNNVIRMVSTNGIITTVVGNGTAGDPVDGTAAKSGPFAGAAAITGDAAGNIYMTSGTYIYRVDSSGIIRRISGGGNGALADGAPASATIGFSGLGLKVDGNGDLYVADGASSLVRKLILNSPASLLASGGNNQSGPAGSALAGALQVMVNGRAGIGVAGQTVNFAVTAGSAKLSASSATTDATGMASVTVTLGTAGAVTISATVAGSTLPAAQFTLTALDPSCTIGPPTVTSVRSLSDFGGFTNFGSGSWLELKGTNLAINARLWAGGDFQGAAAPTKLDGTSVSIDGNAGFVEYISSGQVNVQAPADATTGPVQITVSNCAGTSAPITVPKTSIAPGMLAPASFNVGGRQYLVALFQDGATFVGKTGLIAGAPFRPAKPGDQITAYGIGFGGVTPAIAPGTVVSQSNAIPGLTISFGQTPASLGYAGLAPSQVGLYQFNITVPNLPDGDYLINVSVNGTPVQQTLYLTVAQ